MGWRQWIVTSHRRVDLRDIEILLATKGESPSPDGPEDYLIESDARGNPVAFVQPVGKGRITVTLDRDWQNWPPEWTRSVTARLGGPIRSCITLDYKNRADLEGIDPEPIMGELVATSERALHQTFVWLRLIGEHWRWPAVMAGYNNQKNKFFTFTADET